MLNNFWKNEEEQIRTWVGLWGKEGQPCRLRCYTKPQYTSVPIDYDTTKKQLLFEIFHYNSTFVNCPRRIVIPKL